MVVSTNLIIGDYFVTEVSTIPIPIIVVDTKLHKINTFPAIV